MNDVKWFGDTAFVGPMAVNVLSPTSQNKNWSWSINVTGSGWVAGENEATEELARSKAIECALAAVESFKMATGEESPAIRRERIAVKCLAGLLSDPDCGDESIHSRERSKWAIQEADALIAILDAPKERK